MAEVRRAAEPRLSTARASRRPSDLAISVIPRVAQRDHRQREPSVSRSKAPPSRAAPKTPGASAGEILPGTLHVICNAISRIVLKILLASLYFGALPTLRRQDPDCKVDGFRG